MKRRLVVLVLCVALSALSPNPLQAVTVDEYGDLFHAVLNNMMDNYAWQVDEQGGPILGNGDMDEMYDSTLFAPDILYRFAEDLDHGDEDARAQVQNLAHQTVAYEMKMLGKYLLGDEHPFCTGCNFNLLIDIYLLNKFVQESSNYPRPVGVCGTFVSGTASTHAKASAGLALLALPSLFIVIQKREAGGA